MSDDGIIEMWRPWPTRTQRKTPLSFAGMPLVLDDSLAANEIRLVPPPATDPFPKPGEPDNIEVTAYGITRYRTLTREQFEREFPTLAPSGERA
jgi:hypothetical protein